MWLGAEITNISQCLRPPIADRSEGLSPLSIGDLAGSFLLLAGGEAREEREKAIGRAGDAGKALELIDGPQRYQH